MEDLYVLGELITEANLKYKRTSQQEPEPERNHVDLTRGADRNIDLDMGFC